MYQVNFCVTSKKLFLFRIRIKNKLFRTFRLIEFFFSTFQMTKQKEIFKMPRTTPKKPPIKLIIKKKSHKLIELEKMPIKVWQYPTAISYKLNEGVKIYFDNTFTIIREPYDVSFDFMKLL